MPITPTAFEQMLEDLHAATVAGDETAAADLRTAIETDLNDRGRPFGLVVEVSA